MRYRRLPPAATVETLREVRGAVPRSPAETDDCCARIVERTAVGTREDASAWLVFLSALGCVERSDAGYYREPRDGETRNGERPIEELAGAFESGVFGVRELLSVLEEGRPLGPAETLERLDGRTRRRLARTGAAEEYVTRVLGWAEVFGLVRADDDGYVRNTSQS